MSNTDADDWEKGSEYLLWVGSGPTRAHVEALGHALQGREHCCGARVAVLAVLRQGLQHHAVERVRDVGQYRRGRGRDLLDVLGLSLALLAIGTLPSRLRWPGAAARRKRRHRRP